MLPAHKRYLCLITSICLVSGTLVLAMPIMAQERGSISASRAALSTPILNAPLSSAQVIAGAEKMYRQRLSDLAHAGYLDQDADFLAQLNKIMQTLLTSLAHDYPGTRAWQWEIHSSHEPEESALSMAGGKILVNQWQVQKLSLNQAELAMLLSHEIAHTALEHNRLEYEHALMLFPAWRYRSFDALEDAVDNDTQFLRALAPLCKQQEEQADQIGLQLAWRAGFPLQSLVNFYKKLSRHSANPNFDTASHPAPAQRWMAMRELALQLSGAAVR